MQTRFLHYFKREITEINFTLVYETYLMDDRRFLLYRNQKITKGAEAEESTTLKQAIYVNMFVLKNAEAEINWYRFNQSSNKRGINLQDISGIDKPFKDKEQVFLLKHDGTKDNLYLHDYPHYVLVDNQTRLFDCGEKGLNNARDYEIFRKGGFNSTEEYQIAKPLEITGFDELNQYLNLNISAYTGCSFDELLLITIISKLSNGSKTEFQKLYNHFLKEEEAYMRVNGKEERKLPKWYTKRMRTEQDVKVFLVSSDHVKLFGTFKSDDDLFETIHVKRRKVVVDGSNVAYNSNMADLKRGLYGAELKNILTLLKKLKEEYDFKDIHVMSDANLIHKVKDTELLKEIKALCKYSETPSGIPADLYLINYVKKHHCLLVTNDTFKDWKMADKWIEDNIDFYRVKFMLNGNIVVLPYMERFEKQV